MEGSEEKGFPVVNSVGRVEQAGVEHGRSGAELQSRTGTEKGRTGAEEGTNDSLVIDEDKQNDGKSPKIFFGLSVAARTGYSKPSFLARVENLM